MKKHIWLAAVTALILTLGSVGPVRAEIIPAQGEGQIGLQAVVLCQDLTLRQEPNASSKAVKTLHYGDRIIVQPQTGGWAACFLSDSVDSGRSGWVNEDYLAIDPAWYRTEKATPVYAWNETTAPKVALLDKNTTLPILKAERDWLVVSLRGAAGWIHVPGNTAGTAQYAALPGTAEGGRQDGERFEETIILEGMAETVRYEHAVNHAIGFEIDYDYESFERRSGSDRERFVSRYDDPNDPQNYLEVVYSAMDPDAVTASIRETLSKSYDITVAPYTLDRAGSCTKINASSVKGANRTADIMQTVYIIPAAEGCIVALARYTFESADGFGTRFSYIMNTLVVTNAPLG